MKEIYEMKGGGRSIPGIAEDLGIARNTVRRYLNSPDAMRPKPRARRASKLDSYTEYVDRRLVSRAATKWTTGAEEWWTTCMVAVG